MKSLPDDVVNSELYVSDNGVVSCAVWDGNDCYPDDDDRWKFSHISGRRHTLGELLDAFVAHYYERHMG